MSTGGSPTGSTIVQLANFVSPVSGGLRTVLSALARGYADAGHEVVQVLPGVRDQVVEQPWGRTVQLRSPALPGTGYRVLTDRSRVLAALDHAAPDRLEVHDRTTLRGTGRWARRAGVPSLVVSHERLDRWLHQWLPARLPLDAAADRSNTALAAAFDAVVCTTAWAGHEFARIDVPVRQVPLGVDLEAFRPSADGAGGDRLELVLASRLSHEKRPDLAVAAALELRRRGVDVRLRVAGEGPRRDALRRQAAGGPVELLGFVAGRERLAALLGEADVVLAPGPVETFGLSALEALACGTPVVGNASSALPEVLGDAGCGSAGTPRCFADAVERVRETDAGARRLRARRRAEAFPWSATLAGFLDVHRLQPGRPRSGRVAA